MSYSHAADGLLAPRLQAGLQRFAKPWWRRRALRVFRDESSLSANPHLWSSITAALDSAQWFVLLLSPDGADSPWVNREVEYWLEHKDPERILPVLTEGRFVWDDATGSVDPSSSAPPALLGAFSEEPRWVDLRWARHETQLDLRDSRFRAAVADIASAVRGVPKDDLESEEVRQHRRTVRTAWSAGIALALLAVAAGVAAVYANYQRQEADTQRQVAEDQTAIALANESRAEEQTQLAERAEVLARARELAASAINVLDDDPELSILLGLEGLETVPAGEPVPIETLAALREAIHGSQIARREQIAPDGYLWLALSADGTRLATAAEATGVVRVVDTSTWETLWEYSDPDTIDTIDVGEFSPDGRWLTVTYVDSTSVYAGFAPPEGGPTEDALASRLLILDAASGAIETVRDFPDCPTSVGGAFSPDGRWLTHLTGSDPVDGWCNNWRTDVIDTASWDVDRSVPLDYYALAGWSEDGTRLVLSTPGTVLDAATLEPVADAPIYLDAASLSPDGSLLAGLDETWQTVRLFETATGTPRDILTDLNFPGQDVRFTTDGKLIAITGGAETVVWDLTGGTLLHRLPTGAGSEVGYDAIRGLLYHTSTTGQLTVWDISGEREGEFGTTLTGEEVLDNSISVADSTGAFATFSAEGPRVGSFDPSTGEGIVFGPLVASSPASLGNGAVAVTLAKGLGGPGTERGPMAVWDPASGEITEVAGCWATFETYDPAPPGSAGCTDREGTFTFYEKPFVDPNGARLLASSPLPYGTGEVSVYDIDTLELISTAQLDDHWGTKAYGGEWVVVADGSDVMWVRDTNDGEALLELGPGTLGNSLARLEVGPEGRLLAWTQPDGGFTVVDTDSWEPVLAAAGAHTGRTQGLAFSPDGSQLMSSGTDGLVKVWNLSTGSEIHRLPVADVSDGYWLNDHRIVVGTSSGLWTTLTLDFGELVELARSRLTRGFTPVECDLYRIESCG